MRNCIAAILVVILVVIIIIPTILVRGCTIGDSKLKNPRNSTIKVFNHQSKQVHNMDLEEYVKGVVAAEMPASFELEALKAQAVVARTYVLHRVFKDHKIPEHPEAVITTDPQTAQAWLTKEALQKKWGFVNYLFYWSKISRAVEITTNQVVTYQGELIEALYHSNAGGLTEEAANVWGNPVPYLKSVKSEFDQYAKNYSQEFNFSWVELDQRLGTTLGQLIEQNPNEQIDNQLLEILELSESQRILQIRVGGSIFTGQEFRKSLDLPSTKCIINSTPKGVQMITYGNGHGVGMSQYGANGMAKHGHTYLQILNYYYPGTRVNELAGGI